MRDRFSDRRQMVVCGAEAHVCVLQTAMGLQREGYQVFVVADAVGTRAPDDLRAALERMQQAGLVMVTTEMVVFEWLARSDRPEFRDVLKLIK
jgi:nicotinamidase-related amidase